MRVFLSYASEQQEVAESVALSLRGRGHAVFFDRSDLPPGDSYDDRIQRAVVEADACVFLVSPEAVSPGRWTLTELAFAQQKWPSPRRRLLPVMVVPTNLASVPAYLKAVTVLEPKGNVAAEVAAALEDLRGNVRRWPIVVSATIGAAVLLVSGYTYFGRSSFEVELGAGPVERISQGIFGDQPVFRLPITIRNVGEQPAVVTHVIVETDPSGALEEQPESAEPGKQRLSEGTFPTTPLAAAGPGAGVHTYETYAYMSPASVSLAVSTFRVCAEVAGTRQCTPRRPWQPAGVPELARAFALPSEVAGIPVGVASETAGFLVATRAPNALHRLTSTGVVLISRGLDAEPTVINSGPSGLFVGMRPDRIARLDPTSLRPVAENRIAAAGVTGAFGGPVSTTPASLAQDGAHLFVLTRGGSSAAGLFVVDPDMKALRVPRFFPDVAFDLNDVDLTTDAAAVWGTQTATTPASLYRFSADSYVEYGGHEYGIVACAHGLALWNGRLILPTCDAQLQAVGRPDGGIAADEVIGRLDSAVSERDVWATYRIEPIGGRIVIAINLTRQPAGDARPELVLQEIAGGAIVTLLRQDDAHVAALAANETAILVVIEHSDGRRMTLALRHAAGR